MKPVDLLVLFRFFFALFLSIDSASLRCTEVQDRLITSAVGLNEGKAPRATKKKRPAGYFPLNPGCFNGDPYNYGV